MVPFYFLSQNAICQAKRDLLSHWWYFKLDKAPDSGRKNTLLWPSLIQCERQSCCILKCHFGCLHQGHSIYWRILKLCINNVQGCKIVQEIPFSLCFQLLRGTSSSKNPWRDISEKSLIFFIGISMNVWFNKYILYTFNSRNFTFHLQTAEIELCFKIILQARKIICHCGCVVMQIVLSYSFMSSWCKNTDLKEAIALHSDQCSKISLNGV